MQRNTWPGLALAGGVLIAAIVALLILGAAHGRPPADLVPGTSPPASTRIFPTSGAVSGATAHRPRHHHARPPAASGGSAAASQYGADGNRGTVLDGP